MSVETKTASADSKQKIVAIFNDYQLANFIQTDRLLGGLLAVQWIFAVFLGFVVSPKTWIGGEDSTHIHVFAAVILGSLICFPMIGAAWKNAGHPSTRIGIGASTMLMAALFIHLTGGRIETHFFIFTLMAILSLYKDWRVLLCATVVIALDHVVRGVFWPESVFGILTTSYWRILEHAAYVVFEVAFLVKMCLNGERQMLEAAKRQVELEENNTLINSMLDEMRQEKEEVERQKVESENLSRQMREQKEDLAENVKAILAGMKAFEAGNLAVRLQTNRQDEIGQLIKGFNHTVETISGIIEEVHGAAAFAANTSVKVSASTEELVRTSSSQFSQMQEVTHSMERVFKTITDNASMAKQTVEVVQKNSQVARDGGEIMQQTVAKIRQIAGVVTDSAQIVDELGESGKKIGDIVSVIKDIAEQTNLLALNASVEAARAGDQGKGFAVVADEVRKLAERTSTATEEIGKMILNIQNVTENAVSSMTRGKDEVAEGIKLADNAGSALQEILQATQEMTQMINQIADANQQQSGVSAQVGGYIEEISEASSNMSTEIAGIAKATEDMNRFTQNLNQLVAKFDLKGDRHAFMAG